MREDDRYPDDPKHYLGDSVYVTVDGDSLVLTTENGFAPTNRIVLEPAVYEALVRYVKSSSAWRRHNA